MKVKYFLTILLLAVLIITINPEKISMAQEDTTSSEGIEEDRSFDPPLIGYQGRLLENGNPVSGNRTMTFEVFHSQNDGTAIWAETKLITVNNGLFHTNLGDTMPFQFATINEMDQNLWLEVTVGSDTMPRQLLTGSAYAFSLVPGARITGDTTDFILQALNENNTGLFGGSRFGTGVFGESFGMGSMGAGVHGVSDSGVGVLGESNGAGNEVYGVRGYSDLATGVGGSSDVGIGVAGWSVDAAGVHGSSQNGPGVYAGSGSNGADWGALHAHAFDPNGIGVVSITESTNTNMELVQMGDGPLLKAYSPIDLADPANMSEKASIENDGTFKQALEANGLVKVGLLFECGQADEYGDGGVTLIRSFNNVGGEITLSASVGNPGDCTIGFDFDISDRYWIAQDPGTDPFNPIHVTCSRISNTELRCIRYDLFGTIDNPGVIITSGEIMLIIY